MVVTSESEDAKALFKEAIIEAMTQENGLFDELFYEIVEDIALARAIDESKGSPAVPLEDVLEFLESET